MGVGRAVPEFRCARATDQTTCHAHVDSFSSDRIPAGVARRVGPSIGQSGGAPGSTQGNAPAGSTELRQILPGSKFRTAAGPLVKPSKVRTWPADILTIDGQIQKTFHILIPRWRLTVGTKSGAVVLEELHRPWVVLAAHFGAFD